MKKIRPLIDFSEIEDFPLVTWRELSINARMSELVKERNKNSLSQDEINIDLIIDREEMFESLSRLSKIGVVKKIGSGKNNALYILIKDFYARS